MRYLSRVNFINFEFKKPLMFQEFRSRNTAHTKKIRELQNCRTVHIVFLPFLSVEILKFKCTDCKALKSWKNKRFQRNEIWVICLCLTWLRLNSEVSFQLTKSRLFSHSANRNLQKVQNR